jgi:hypothetical protein
MFTKTRDNRQPTSYNVYMTDTPSTAPQWKPSGSRQSNATTKAQTVYGVRYADGLVIDCGDLDQARASLQQDLDLYTFNPTRYADHKDAVLVYKTVTIIETEWTTSSLPTNLLRNAPVTSLVG